MNEQKNGSGIEIIPKCLTSYIFEYTRPPCHHVLRHVCRNWKNVLDDESNPTWKSIIRESYEPKVHRQLVWSSSVGCTALIMRSSKIFTLCIVCGNHCNVTHNKFYDVFLCERCKHLGLFETITLRRGCWLYFLNIQQMQNEESLVKVVHKGSTTVLLHHIRKIGDQLYPSGLLDRKIEARNRRRINTEMKRVEERHKREHLAKEVFERLSMTFPLRTDELLKCQHRVRALITSFGSYEDVYGDAHRLKIWTRTKGDDVGIKEHQYACMLTYLRKNDLLDGEYGDVNEECPHPRHLFKYHHHGIKGDGGLHFYERIGSYAASIKEYDQRCKEVEIQMIVNTTTKEQRLRVAIIMCVEDDCEYNVDAFRDFVQNSQGNPAKLARQLRKQKFLLENNFEQMRNHLFWSGHCWKDANTLAKLRVLNNTKGYPPMKRTCHVELDHVFRLSEFQP